MSATWMADWAATRMGLDQLQRGANPVSDYSYQMQQMLPALQMVDDLWGGTRQMRAKASKWLPIEPKETPEKYVVRVHRTFLYNMFARTVHTLSGKPFSRPITIVPDSMDPQIEEWLEDIDKQGNHLDVFAHDLMRAIIKDGIAHVLVDMPPKPTTGFISIADAKDMQLRPYFCRIEAKNVLGWRSTVINSKPVLTQLRIQEFVDVPEGPYSDRWAHRVRVFNRVTSLVGGNNVVTYELWEKQTDEASKNDKWVQIAQGQLEGMDEIPLRTFYGSRKTGYMTANPPLEDLAWLNIEHWQSGSDQRHILHVARVPILFACGFPEIDPEDPTKKTPISIAPNTLVVSSNENAKLAYVEHTGNAISSGRDDLEDIENRAAMMGTQLLRKKTVTTTATEEKNDDLNEDSELSATARNLEDGLESCLCLAGKWVGIEEEKTGDLTIFKDFSMDDKKVEELTLLLAARQAQQISQQTFLNALVKFGVLETGFDVQEEIEVTGAEIPKGLGLFANTNDTAAASGVAAAGGPTGKGGKGEAKTKPAGDLTTGDDATSSGT
jgi:hypothetical protein